MAAPAGDHDSLDGCLAHQAGFRFAAVYAVLELEKAFFALGVHIIGNGRTAEGDRLFQDLLHRDQELAQLILRYGRSAAAGPDAGPEQRFIGVNVADPTQEFLVEKRAFDGCLAAAEQRQEAVEIDFQRFDAGGVEVSCPRDAQAAEAAGIDETQFLA